MATYKVQQMAEIWYETEIEAESQAEAIQKAYEDSDLDWSSKYDTLEFQDRFYTLNTNEAEADWEEYK